MRPTIQRYREAAISFLRTPPPYNASAAQRRTPALNRLNLDFWDYGIGWMAVVMVIDSL